MFGVLHPTGVFFAVCMALLVLNLSISIFVVKLLHHNEKEVKEMSVSACLLDKYGSSSQTFLESNFTSVKTLVDVDQCGGERERGEREDVLLRSFVFLGHRT